MLRLLPHKPFLLIAAIALIPVASFADIVIIGNLSSPIDSLDKKAVKKLWLGKTKKIPGMGKVTILDQGDGSEIREQFYKKVANKNRSQVKAYWAKIIFTGKAFPPKSVASDSQALELVRNSNNTIAYVDSSSVDDSVKILFKVK